MTIVAHYPEPPAEEGCLTYLQELLAPEIHLTTGSNGPPSPDTAILIAGRPSAADLEASPKLRALIVPWAGVPAETLALIRATPHISIHNLHHNAVPVAELAIALLLAAAKFIVPMDNALRTGNWSPRYRPSPALLLRDKTALVLGYGAIGREVTRLCKGLGMSALAIRAHPDPGPSGPADEVYSAEALAQLLPRANALIICLPLTPRTRGLIGFAELNLLPSEAVLVNIGRGPIVDEAALFRALSDGHLYAAGLDVWYNYPDSESSRVSTAPSNYPFARLENVVFSPHRGGATRSTNRLRVECLASLLNTAARGETMPNRVDLEAGY
jgi:phosphoglycerate dehydrogenase-like enzyme